MRIIKDNDDNSFELEEYPDIFVSAKEKDSDKYIKSTANYFANLALRQYRANLDTFVKNYNFFKGILSEEDFYLEPVEKEVQDFADVLMADVKTASGLEKGIVHYSIMSQPINMLVGEYTKKPDNTFVKDFSEDGQAEELQYLLDNLTEYTRQLIQGKLALKLSQQGIDLETEEGATQLAQMTEEELEERITTYTSLYEKWGNRMLQALKMQFNLKEVSEETITDLFKSGYGYIHVYEDNSPTGFNIENINPKNYFELAMPENKYAKDAYAAGVIQVLDVTQIVSRFNLTKEEVDALREPFVKDKNLADTGIFSIGYNTYYPNSEFVEKVRNFAGIEEYLSWELGISDTQPDKFYGEKFPVLTAYFKGKNKIGKLTYVDADGFTQTTIVDETYKNKEHPNQIDLEWYYDDVLYRITKIGKVLYDIEEVKCTDRIPISGGKYDPKNSDVKSLIDLMKPLQVLYNIVMNQLFKVLKKDKGVLLRMNLRRIPVPKDGTHEDALDVFETQLRELGVIFEDDSPENTGTAGNNTNLAQAVDLSQHNYIQSRYTLAQQLKQDCWELIGINRERLGGVAASQTAMGTQTAMSQSYSQTEPWFVHHEYVMNDLYQLILDTAQYYESTKEDSTLSFISGEGEHVFIKVNGKQLSGRDLRCFVTSRSEDMENLQRSRQLAQAMLQNGVSAYEINQLNSSKSPRAIDQVLKKVKEREEQFRQQQQQIEQQKTQAIQEQTQVMAAIEREKMDREDMNKQLDRESKERVSAINTFSRQDNNLIDADGNGTPDILDIMKDQREATKIENDFKAKQTQATNTLQANIVKNKLEMEKLKMQAQENEKDRELKREELKTNAAISKRNKN